MVVQDQSVGAGNWQVQILAGTDDFVEQSLAPLDEDQDVTGPHWAPMIGARFSVFRWNSLCFQHHLNILCDALRQLNIGLFIADEVMRIVPIVLFWLLGFLHKRPEIDAPRHLGLKGAVDHLIAETFGQIASECMVHER